jgi:hypothetical protein
MIAVWTKTEQKTVCRSRHGQKAGAYFKKVPARPLAETRKTDGTRNPMHAVSYASVAAGRWKGNDDEEKSPLTTLLPATPERRHKEKIGASIYAVEETKEKE